MQLRGENLTQVSFPLGGIGAGCIGLSGNGRLIDWEIFHEKANKNSHNFFSAFAVKAELPDGAVDARILQGDLTGAWSGSDHCGMGPEDCPWSGVPHFRDCTFTGEFPLAEIAFHDPAFPGEVKLQAWSVFIPGDARNSGLPAACFEITLTNNSTEKISYTSCGIISNPWREIAAANFVQCDAGISTLVLSNNLPPDDFEHGNIALSTDAHEVSYQQYWYRGNWCDSAEVFWRDFTRPGRLGDRTYPAKTIPGHDTGTLGAHRELAPGESWCTRWVISWYSPWAKNDWDGEIERKIREQHLPCKNLWRSYYATVWRDAADAAHDLWLHYDKLRRETWAFHDALYATTIPRVALEAVSANLAVLKTPTLLRLEDGTVWGWEGLKQNSGSCFGSCSHVWNYAQALALLFPDLERTIRESQFNYNFSPQGALNFRVQLPLGVKSDDSWPAADGSFGEILKTYRDWKISGDTAWMLKMWPAVQKVLHFTWSGDNEFQWDPDRTGVLHGRQHHTLDMELFGPNVWLSSHYLAALRAAAEMAEVAGEAAFGAECRQIYSRGRHWIETNLFNGEYYIQQLDLSAKGVLEKFHVPSLLLQYWDDEHGEIKYQIGTGCAIDQHLGQWYASLYGLGDILDPGQNKSTLQAIYRHNFVRHVRDVVNVWRRFALNDEGGTLICTWPERTAQPAIPLPYHQETMTGFEWALACHLIMVGCRTAGEELIHAIRSRYDGYRRNPWNEFECGNNYARSLASYALLQAYSGFRYDMTRGKLSFAPLESGDFTTFWSIGTAWGLYRQNAAGAELEVWHGKLVLRQFGANFVPHTVQHDAQLVKYQVKSKVLEFAAPVEILPHQKLVLAIAD